MLSPTEGENCIKKNTKKPQKFRNFTEIVFLYKIIIITVEVVSVISLEPSLFFMFSNRFKRTKSQHVIDIITEIRS